MVYASTGEQHQLVWVDRQGTVTPISDDRAAFRNPRLSPDDTRIAVGINDDTRRSDIWIYDAARGAKTRMTTSDHNLNPVRSPDGSSITFAPGGLVELPIDGSGARTVLLSREQARAQLAKGTNPYASSWSADGRHLLFRPTNAISGRWTAAINPTRMLCSRATRTIITVCSHPTGSGWRTFRMRRDGPRSTLDAGPTCPAGSRRRSTVARSHGGRGRARALLSTRRRRAVGDDRNQTNPQDPGAAQAVRRSHSAAPAANSVSM